MWAIDVKLQASVMAIAEIAEVTPCRTIARFAVTTLALIPHALAIAAAFTRPLALPLHAAHPPLPFAAEAHSGAEEHP